MAYGATNLLHHWQQQEPSLWPSALRRQPAPLPFVAPAASNHTQKYRQQPALQPIRGQPAAHGMCRAPCTALDLVQACTAVLREEHQACQMTYVQAFTKFELNLQASVPLQMASESITAPLPPSSSLLPHPRPSTGVWQGVWGGPPLTRAKVPSPMDFCAVTDRALCCKLLASEHTGEAFLHLSLLAGSLCRLLRHRSGYAGRSSPQRAPARSR